MNKSLGSDNHSGVHPKILASLTELNQGHSPSYGTDDVTEKCRRRFKDLFGPECESFFVFNGTAANVLSIKSHLKSFESVLCHENSHLNLDECGAPEMIAGVKLIPLPSLDGKLTPEICEEALIRGGDQHFSQPRMLSITQPTEVGTLYSLDEMKKLSMFAKENNLYFHVDGARLIHAAAALNCSFKELITDNGVDVVSFGGTKNGLLFGEAVLIFDPSIAKEFKYVRKQCLQLPSKMRFLAGQFLRLFEQDLWRHISDHERSMAQYLEKAIAGIPQLRVTQKVQSNALFVQMPKHWVKPLKKECYFYVWDEKEWVVRWMMSFDTSQEELDHFVKVIKELSTHETEGNFHENATH